MNHKIHINFADPSRQAQLSPRNIALEIKKLSSFPGESFKNLHHAHKPRSKIEKAGFFSMLHFTFGIKLIRFVNSLKTRTLHVEDLDPLGDNESAETLEDKFTQEYQILKGRGYKNTKLIGLILARIFAKDILLQFIWQAIFASSRILAAYFMFLMLSVVRDPTKPTSQGYFPAIGLFISYIVGVYALHQFSFDSSYVLTKIKTGFTGMLFRKITRLSHHAVHIMNLGKLINLTANDINNFERIHFLISLVLAPLILIGGWGLLMSFWGTSSLVGIGYMAFIWIIQIGVSRKTLNLRRHKSSVSDERNRSLIEGIEGIKTLKLFTWEFDFIEKIRKIRAQEVNDLKAFNYFDSISRAFYFSSHWIGSYLIYLTFCLRGGVISTVLTFPTIYLLGFLRQLCLFQTFQALTFLVEMRLASRRICSIMNLSEAGHKREVSPPRNSENCVEFRNFSAYWVSNDLETDVEGPSSDVKKYYPVISNINLDIKKGSLVTIIGDNGSGKSSLLLSFTGEIAKYTGELRYKGRYAYVAQEKVCFSGPLKDSILFGKAYDEEFFWEVLEACCIANEIRKLPKQEMTEIRERGANLSEGFRARVALARAVYSKADIYLLDACWSNLDTKLEKKIFRNCIQGLLKGKTVIMVTHQLHLAKYASHLIVMEKGEIVAQGTYEEVIQRDSDVKAVSFLKTLTEENQSDLKMHRYASVDFQGGKIVDSEEEHERFLVVEKNGILSIVQDPGLFYEGEKLDEWSVTYKVYWRYFKRIFNWFTVILFLLLFIGDESTSWLFTIFVDKWGKREWTNTQAYVVLGPVTILSLPVSLIKYVFYFYLTLNAADKLHDKMLTGVFQSPAKFFDKNPSGRIMNRFSNDIGILDKFLIASLLDIAEGFFAFWITLLALWTTNAWLFIPFTILLVAYLIIHAWCYKALHQTRGLELTTRSPMYSLFLIGVNGLSVVRARGQSEDMIRSFYKRADEYSRANIAHMTAIRVMSFFMDLVIELIVIGTFAVFLGTKNTPLMSGFFVNMLGNLPATVQWILRDFMRFHLLLASVARAINFCEHYRGTQLVHDGDQEKIAQGWPKSGDIEVKNAYIRYSHHSDWVLKNLSIDFKSKEKIAVFGNSKAGVSSLIAMLTRMYDIEKPHGRGDSYVKINNVDIQDVGLHLLRKLMTVIRQDCFLLTGTIRDNLDPWKNYTDQEIWEVLEIVGLRRFIEGLPKKLESRVSKGSHLFSMGEKQLLCIARGLLKDCLIFIQDEATAHLDFTKEQIIQRSLLKKYKNATVINITRRILTVCEYDKVLLIDNGNKVEYDEPYRLLVKNIGDEKITNTEGYLASFIVGMGPKAANKIFNYVMTKFYQKHKMALPVGIDVDRQGFQINDNYDSEKNQNLENTTINSAEISDSEGSSRNNIETPNKKDFSK